MSKSKTNIEDLRLVLLDTLKDLRNREQPMDIDRAKAVAQVASVLVDTAKTECEYLRITGKDRSEFFVDAIAVDALPDGITSIARHLIRG